MCGDVVLHVRTRRRRSKYLLLDRWWGLRRESMDKIRNQRSTVALCSGEKKFYLKTQRKWPDLPYSQQLHLDSNFHIVTILQVTYKIFLLLLIY